MTGTCLQFDVGNSGAKWRLLEGGAVRARGRYRVDDGAGREALLNCAARVDRAQVASVAAGAREQALSDLVMQRWGVTPWFARTRARSGNVKNSYAEPGRMGVDRWLAMVAARQRHSGRCCVVDAGSALTIDLVAADGRHEGGYIIPGPALMERALLLDTDRVRFDDDIGYDLTPGRSTAEAVRHGIALAQAGALRLALNKAHWQGTAGLYFCGGAGAALMQLTGLGGALCKDLVFEGLSIEAQRIAAQE